MSTSSEAVKEVAEKNLTDLKFLLSDGKKTKSKANKSTHSQGESSAQPLTTGQIHNCIERQRQLDIEAAKNDTDELIKQAENSKAEIWNPQVSMKCKQV